jgi:hypothetical protein
MTTNPTVFLLIRIFVAVGNVNTEPLASNDLRTEFRKDWFSHSKVDRWIHT